MIKLCINPKVCAGCNVCMLVCSFKHYLASSPRLANIYVTGDEATADFTPKVCIGCEERFCVQVCPMDALSVDETTGAVMVDHDLCTTCEACVGACPHNGIRLREDADGNPCIGVCDLCDGEPQCAKYCRQGAITMVNRGNSN